jgi:hypothetical protein
MRAHEILLEQDMLRQWSRSLQESKQLAKDIGVLMDDDDLVERQREQVNETHTSRWRRVHLHDHDTWDDIELKELEWIQRHTNLAIYRRAGYKQNKQFDWLYPQSTHIRATNRPGKECKY